MYVYVCVCVRLWDRQTLTFVVPYARGFAWGPKMYRRRRPVYLPILTQPQCIGTRVLRLFQEIFNNANICNTHTYSLFPWRITAAKFKSDDRVFLMLFVRRSTTQIPTFSGGGKTHAAPSSLAGVWQQR